MAVTAVVVAKKRADLTVPTAPAATVLGMATKILRYDEDSHGN